MGFHVSTLHNLPVGNIRYFVHVLDMASGGHASWINENLSTLADSFGTDAGLVSGPKNLSEELYTFLLHNLSSDYGAVERLLHLTTCLIISEGHLAHTQKPVYLIPVATPEDGENSQELISVLLDMIAKALRSSQLHELVRSLGAYEVQLTTANEGFFVCKLRYLNDVLELKPNIAGLGVNLNAIIEELLPSEERSI